MEITADTLNQFFGMITVVILAIIAWYNKQRTGSAATTAAATTSTAATNAAIAATETAAVQQIATVQAYVPQDTRARDATGKLTTNQVGSEYWLNAGYVGPEPDEATKKRYTDAAAAYQAAQAQADALAATYGKDRLQPALKAITTK
ncbi:MAG: hypothetical protein WC455_25165 [Dehalococcoidia bacterium]|jgi:hypothetical protein